MASEILGDWTHRRGDARGARSVAAEIEHPRPSVTWSWRPDHGGRVDQVRVAARSVVVATMTPHDPNAPGWEHAVVYVIDAETGAERARRALPDPVPVAAMVIDGDVVHVVGTRRGEPIFWYALAAGDLAPRHRRVAVIADGVLHDDVLDAWATPGGGLWLELEASPEGESLRAHTYAFADASGAPMVARLRDAHSADGQRLARDACAGGHELFVPTQGAWNDGEGSTAPSVSRLDPALASGGEAGAWLRASVLGPSASTHALGGDGVIYAVTAAADPAKLDRARVEVLGVDTASGGVRFRVVDDRVAVKAPLGGGARIACRVNGELIFQILGLDGLPCTPMLCARPDGGFDSILLGARGRYVLDAALGSLVLAHRENNDGRVEVTGFAIDHEGLLLGRRAVASWTVEVGDLGGGTTVYAGAGVVVVRGTRAISAIRL